MSSKAKKDLESEKEEMRNSPVKTNNERSIRRLNPLGMRVLVHIRPDADKTDAGLYLPEGAKEDSSESLLAEVVEVASAIDEDTDEEANISGIPMGALVLIDKDCGVKVPWDDALRIVETADVLAVVEELSMI